MLLLLKQQMQDIDSGVPWPTRQEQENMIQPIREKKRLVVCIFCALACRFKWTPLSHRLIISERFCDPHFLKAIYLFKGYTTFLKMA